MSRPLSALLLSLTLPCLLVSANTDAAERWVAFGHGRLLIDRDGSVAEVTLERQLNSSIREVVAQRMRSWRFEPIVEQGRAVRAEAHMRFRIEAEFDADGNAERLGIADVDFYTPNGIADPDRLAERTPPPRYPKRQLRDGFGAALELQVEGGRWRLYSVPVNPLFGAQANLPGLLVGPAGYRDWSQADAAIARLQDDQCPACLHAGIPG